MIHFGLPKAKKKRSTHKILRDKDGRLLSVTKKKRTSKTVILPRDRRSDADTTLSKAVLDKMYNEKPDSHKRSKTQYNQREEAKLTDKQKLFCDCYRANGDGNASRAARDAGYSTSSPSCASSRGAALLKLPQVITYLGTPLDKGNLASPEEVMQFLSTTMRNDANAQRDRLTAARQLQTCYGMNLIKYKVDVHADTSPEEPEELDLSLLTPSQLEDWLKLEDLTNKVRQATPPSSSTLRLVDPHTIEASAS